MHRARGGGPSDAGQRLRVAVLVSGEGTLLQALIGASGPGAPFEVVLVVSDRADAPAIGRARRAGLATLVIPPSSHADRAAWDGALADQVGDHHPDLLVLAGFMRLLGAAVLSRWPGAIINSHPSLLPAFPGAHAVTDALAAGVEATGASVITIDDGVDTGPVLAQREVPVVPGDTAATLHERIKAVERPLLLEVLAHVAATRVPAGPARPAGEPVTPTAPRPAPAEGAHR